MLLLAATIAIFWIPAALPQSQSATVPEAAVAQSPSLSVQTNLVLVPTLVRTKSGELVFTLNAGDFTLTDDGTAQEVTLDDTGNQPLALVIAVETGGAGARRLDSYRNLGPILEALVGNVRHRVAVVGFDSEPRLLRDFTTDMNVAEGAIRNLPAGNSNAAILDGLGFSVDLLSRQPPEYRRAILLISETIDHGSHVQLEDALRKISDTNTAIYSLGFSSSKAEMKHEAPKIFGSINGLTPPAPPGPPGGCMGKDPDPEASKNKAVQAYDCLSLLAPPLRLAKMAAMLAANSMRRNVPESVAQLTGGEFFEFKDSRSLQRDLMTISNHIPNRYVLSFHPRSPHPGLHSIELRLRDYPGLVVTARKSYWADEYPPP